MTYAVLYILLVVQPAPCAVQAFADCLRCVSVIVIVHATGRATFPDEEVKETLFFDNLTAK